MRKINAAQALILGVLHSGAHTGADITRIADSMDFWTFSRSQIYRDIQILTREGAISLRAQDGRTDLIHLLPTGRHLYAEWLTGQPTSAEVAIRDAWYLRYRLSEFDGTDRASVRTEAAAHHLAAIGTRGSPSARAAAAYHSAMAAYFRHVGQ